MAAKPPRKNPYGAFNFILTDDDATRKLSAGFMECSGLDAENMIMEYREGTDQKAGTGGGGGSGAFLRKLSGLERYPNVMLRRGITGDLALWNWRQNVRDADKLNPNVNDPGKMGALNISLLDEKQNVVVTWKLKDPWICKLSGPSLSAKGNEIAIEACEIACTRIEITTSGGGGGGP